MIINRALLLLLAGSLVKGSCDAGEDIGVDENDPSKYYVCSLGEPIFFNCKPGFIFNKNTLECELITRSSNRGPYCPIDQEDTTYFPHETFCNKFYSCALGELTMETCPEGLEYNPDKWSCDWPTPNGCSSSSTSTVTTPAGTETPSPTVTETESPTPTITNSPTPTVTESPTPTTEIPTPTVTESPTPTVTETPTTEPTTPNVTETTIDPTETTPNPPNICPDDNTTIIIVPHPTECHKFYVCFAGQGTESSCDLEGGFEFDPVLLICVPISDTGCTANQTSPPLCKPGDSQITIVPDKEDCTKFYVCYNGTATEYFCDDGTEFDPLIQACVPISDTGCTANQTSPPLCKPGDSQLTIVPDKEDCTKFYVCYNGTATEYFCDDGTEFDPLIQVCVPLSPSGCTANQKPFLAPHRDLQKQSIIRKMHELLFSKNWHFALRKRFLPNTRADED